MKIISRATTPIKYTLVLFSIAWLLLTVGCETYKYVDLTDGFNHEVYPTSQGKGIVFRIDTIEVRHTKDPFDEEPQVYHQHLNFGLKANVTNYTNREIELYMRHSKWGVYTLIPNTNDTLRFVSGSSPSILTIQPDQSVDLSLGNKLYYFYGLFPKNEDYSMDMLNLMEQLNLVYQDSIRSLPIGFAPNAKVFSVNRNKNYW